MLMLEQREVTMVLCLGVYVMLQWILATIQVFTSCPRHNVLKKFFLANYEPTFII